MRFSSRVFGVLCLTLSFSWSLATDLDSSAVVDIVESAKAEQFDLESEKMKVLRKASTNRDFSKQLRGEAIKTRFNYFIQVEELDSAKKEILALKKNFELDFPKRWLAMYHFMLAQVLEQEGDLQNAIENLNPAYRYFHKKASKNELAIVNKIARSWYYIGNSDSAIYYMKAMAKSSRYHKDTIGLSKALMNIAVLSDLNGMRDTAYRYYRESYDLAVLVKDSVFMAKNLMNLGTFYQDRTEYTKAIKEFLKAEKLYKSVGNSKGLAETYNNIALSYISLEDLELSGQYIQKSRQIARENDLKSLIPRLYRTQASYFELKGNDDSLLLYLKKAGYGFKAQNRNCDAATYLGFYLQQLKKSAEASDTLLLLIDSLGANCPGLPKNLSFASRGFYEYQIGNYRKALELLNQVSAFFKDAGYLKTYVSILAIKAESYMALQDFEQAAEFFRLTRNYSDSLRIKDRLQDATRIELQYKQKENERLKDFQVANEKLIESQGKVIIQKEKLTSVLLIAVITVTAFLLILVFLIVSLRNKNELLKEKTEETQRHLAAINEKNRQTSNIISVVAHDIGSPLRSIQGLVYLLREEASSAEIIELTNLIERSAKEGLSISNNLLETAKVARFKKEEISSLRVDEVIASVVALNRPAATSKEIEIHDKSQEILAQGHAPSLRRVVDNLLSNAIKYSPPSSEVFINTKQEKLFYQIVISDSGPGFTEADLARAFKPFQRLSAQPTANENSSGLGLFIVHSLVERMGGTVQIENNTYQGASFIVRLPIDGLG